MPKDHGLVYDEKIAHKMVHRLVEHASTLTKRERSILVTILLNHLEPIDRRRWLSSRGLISCEEKALLEQLKVRY